MDDTPGDASHLQQDSGGLIAELDVKEYLETRERNAREDRAFAYKTKILERAREVTNKTYDQEMRIIKKGMHDLSAKTPNFRTIPHCIPSGTRRPRSYAALKKVYLSTDKAKGDNLRVHFLSKSLPPLERSGLVSPSSRSEAGLSVPKEREGIPRLSKLVRCKTVDPQAETNRWSKQQSEANTPRTVESDWKGKTSVSINRKTLSIETNKPRKREKQETATKTLPPVKLNEEYWRNSTKNIMRRNKFVQNSLSNLYKRRKTLGSVLEEEQQPNFIIQRDYFGQPTTILHSSVNMITSRSNISNSEDWRLQNGLKNI